MQCEEYNAAPPPPLLVPKSDIRHNWATKKKKTSSEKKKLTNIWGGGDSGNSVEAQNPWNCDDYGFSRRTGGVSFIYFRKYYATWRRVLSACVSIYFVFQIAFVGPNLNLVFKRYSGMIFKLLLTPLHPTFSQGSYFANLAYSWKLPNTNVCEVAVQLTIQLRFSIQFTWRFWRGVFQAHHGFICCPNSFFWAFVTNRSSWIKEGELINAMTRRGRQTSCTRACVTVCVCAPDKTFRVTSFASPDSD